MPFVNLRKSTEELTEKSRHFDKNSEKIKKLEHFGTLWYKMEHFGTLSTTISCVMLGSKKQGDTSKPNLLTIYHTHYTTPRKTSAIYVGVFYFGLDTGINFNAKSR